MTDAPRPSTSSLPQARSFGGPLGVLWLSSILFLAVLALLAARMRMGEDPALQGHQTTASRPARHVLVRRVVERRVIVHVPPSEATPPTTASQQAGAAGAFTSSAPLTHAS
jgi:hypothetical protein